MYSSAYISSAYTWFAFALGAIVGSFLNVCIFRIPEQTFFKTQRSVCRSCNTVIPFYYNIPIVSYLILKGRAACCGAKLSIQYPLIEFITAVCFVFIYWRFPFLAVTDGQIDYDFPNAIRWGHATVFFCLMLVCAVIDLRHMIIPDVISIPMIIVTPLVVYLHPELDWQSAAFGIVIGGGILYAVAWVYWLLRREVGMGFGDVKLLAGIGGWLGYQAILPTVFFASLVGSLAGIVTLVRRRNVSLKTAIPFGPFLAAGAFFELMCGNRIQEWLFYLSSP